MRVIVKSSGVNNYATLHVGIGREYVNEYSYYLWQTVYIGEDCLPRVKNIIKKVGTTSAIAAFYGPVILYVYAYVIIDGVLSNTDNSFAKWFDRYLTGGGTTPLPPHLRNVCLCGSVRPVVPAKYVLNTAENFWEFSSPKKYPSKKSRIQDSYLSGI